MVVERKVPEEEEVTKDHLYKINNCFQPLTPLLDVFSLNCNKFQSQKCTLSTFLFFSIPILVLGSLSFVTFFYKIRDVYATILVSIKYTDAVQVTFDYFQYIVDLYFIYKNSIRFKEYHLRYRQIDELLSFSCWSELKGKLLKLIVFFSVCWICTGICDYCAWILSAGLEVASLFSISYIFLLIKILTSLDLTSHVMNIEFRLRSIVNNIQALPYKTNNGPRTEVNNILKWKIRGGISVDAFGNVEENADRDSVSKVQSISKSYIWLLDQVDYVNNVFGTRILLNCLSLLIDMIRFTNIAFRIVMGSQHLRTLGYFPVFSTICRLMMCVALLMNMARHCEMAYSQQSKIISVIDHINIINEPRKDLAEALYEFRGLVQTRPIIFQMSNLNRLDYSLLSSMGSTVVTYTIILLQSVN